MKIPAAMARRARRTPRPLLENNENKPVRISHMANSRKPIFLVNLIKVSPFFYGSIW
jgi:hypothetical protein